MARCCWAADRGCSLHIWMKEKKDLIQNNPVLFFFTFHAKLKTIVFLKHEGFVNMFRIRVKECIHRSVKCLHMNRAWGSEGLGSLKDLGH